MDVVGGGAGVSLRHSDVQTFRPHARLMRPATGCSLSEFRPTCVMRMMGKLSVVGDTFYDLRCTIALQYTGWQIYDESWASFRGGNWRRDFRLGGDRNSGGSRDSSRRVRAEHAAVRQDRRRSAALARRAAQTGIWPNRRAHEETECVFHPLYQARPRF